MKVRLIQPSIMLVLILILLQLLPGIYILITEHYENLYGMVDGPYESSVQQYVLACFAFILFVLIGRFFLPINGLNFKLVNQVFVGCADLKINKYAKILGFLSVVIVIYYVMDGGYKKFLAIGTDMDSWEFRLIGYEDRPRYLIALLEIARRFLLPLSLLYLITFRIFYGFKEIKYIFFLVITQLIAGFMTLDRAPFFTLFVVILFPFFFMKFKASRILEISFATFSAMILIGGIVTNLQYNILEFSIIDVMGMGLDFIAHRFFLVPSIAPIELSFALFPVDSSKLFLEYSRLKGLIGAEVVGTSEYESIYVSPVGAIGDIWRNFGMWGICLVGLLLGVILKKVDINNAELSFSVIVVQYFLVFALSFYYVMGVFFSQGAVFALLLCMVHMPLMKFFLKIKI